MIDKDQQKTKLQEFLRMHPVATLATVSVENKAHAAAIYFFIDEDLNFFFITKEDTKKYKDLSKNQHVALVITDSDALSTVQAEGNASVINDAEGVAKVVTNLQSIQFGEHGEKTPPIAHVEAGGFRVIKVTPIHLRWTKFEFSGYTVELEF